MSKGYSQGFLKKVYNQLASGLGRLWTLNHATDSVKTIPSGTQHVSGELSVSNFPSTQGVTGNVSVLNFPSVQPISDNNSSITIDGSVSVSNFPVGIQAAQSGIWVMTPTGIIHITGQVSIANFPATQNIYGLVEARQSGDWTVGRNWNIGYPTDSITIYQGGDLNINNITGQISLPQGAATSANQATEIDRLTKIESALETGSARNWALNKVSDSISVHQASTWDINSVTGTVSLPQGASTSALQTIGNNYLIDIKSILNTGVSRNWTLNSSVDSVGVTGRITVQQGASGSEAWLVKLADSIEVEFKNDSGNPLNVSGEVNVKQSSEWNINSITGSVSLPNGAATSTLQSAGNTSLSNIDLTLKTGVARNWVSDKNADSISAHQASTWNINNVSGIISLPQGAATSALQDTANTYLSGIKSTLNTGVARNWITSFLVDSVSAHQAGIWDINSISGTISLPNGAATSANQTVEIAHLLAVESALETGAARNWTLSKDTDAATVHQGSIWNINSVTGSVSLPNGAATSANQTTEITHLAAIESALETGVARSWSLNKDSDSTTVHQGSTWNINGVTGSISLPNGAATSANQATEIIHLAAIESALETGAARNWIINQSSDSIKIFQGSELNVNSISGVISLPNGASTSALQTAGNSTLTTIDTALKTGVMVHQGSSGSAPWLVKLVDSLEIEFKNDTGNALAVSGVVQQGGIWSIKDISGSISLPNGAATSANQVTEITHLAAIESALETGAARNWTISQATDSIKSFQGSELNVNSISGSISLPNGASTSALQTAGNNLLSTIDATLKTGVAKSWNLASGQDSVLIDGVVTVRQGVSGSQPWLVKLTDAIEVEFKNDSGNPLSISGYVHQGGVWNLKDISGTISLPNGASTAANQSTQITHLAAIESALETGSARNWTLNQQNDSVKVFQGSEFNVNNVSGIISLPQGASTSTLQTTSNNYLSGIDQTLKTGTARNWNLNKDVDNVTVHQGSTWNINGITGSVSLPNGAATSTNQTTEIAHLAAIESALETGAARNWTSNSATDSITFYQGGELNVNSISGVISLPNGASTSALQTTSNNNLSAIDLTLRTGVARNWTNNYLIDSVSVHQASYWNINSISGAISLPNGASTSVLQTVGNDYLSGIDKTLKTGVSRNWNLSQDLDSVKVVISDENGVRYTESNPLPVNVGNNIVISGATIEFRSVISTLNSFTGVLTAGQTFTGLWEEVKDYAGISVIVLTTQYSAINGASVQFSHDASEILRSVTTTIPPSLGQYFSMAPEARYFRLMLTNGAVEATVKAQTMLKFNPPAHVEMPLGASVTDSNLASLHRSMISARLSNGQWKSLEASSLGELKVTTSQNGTFNINSITGSISLPNGAATSELQNSGNASLASIDASLKTGVPIFGTISQGSSGSQPWLVKLTDSIEVEFKNDSGNPLNVTGLVNVSQASDFNINSITGVISLPNGASTSTLQSIGNDYLSGIDRVLRTGVARNWSLNRITDSVEIYQGSDIHINSISGFISLPSGAATSALQNSCNSELQQIKNKINSGISATGTLETNLKYFGGQSVNLGRQDSSASIPIAISTDQPPIHVYTRVTGEFARISRKEVHDNEELRFDIPLTLTSQSTYVGVAIDGTSTSVSGWNVVRTYFDTNGNPNRQRLKTGLSWDNRTVGW